MLSHASWRIRSPGFLSYRMLVEIDAEIRERYVCSYSLLRTYWTRVIVDLCGPFNEICAFCPIELLQGWISMGPPNIFICFHWWSLWNFRLRRVRLDESFCLWGIWLSCIGTIDDYSIFVKIQLWKIRFHLCNYINRK